MTAIVVDHQTVNVLVGTNLTKSSTNGGLPDISKDEEQRLLELKVIAWCLLIPGSTPSR